MSSIYSRASWVIIRVGRGDEAEALQAVRDMNCFAVLARLSPRKASRAYREKAKLAQEKVLEDLDSPEGQTFFDLFPAVIGFGEFDPFHKVSGTV